MARLVGYMANRVDHLHAALEREREVVAPPAPTQPTGWGLGFFQGGEPLHKKRPNLEGTRLDWAQVTKGVLSDCVILHVRQPTTGDFRVENTHPFRFQNWLFAHHGEIFGFRDIAETLRNALPDYLLQSVRGDSDSEHLFAHLLHALDNVGQLDAHDISCSRVLEGLRQAVAELDTWTQAHDAPLSTVNAVLTNGRQMFVLKRGAPMFWVSRRESVMLKPHLVSRYVMVVSDTLEQAADFRRVEDNTILQVNRDLSVERFSL